jgi:hypothetical protein
MTKLAIIYYSTRSGEVRRRKPLRRQPYHRPEDKYDLSDATVAALGHLARRGVTVAEKLTR